MHSAASPERSHHSPVCKGLHRLGACHWFNWFPVGDVTSTRHTGVVRLAHVLLNQHEAPRARGGEALARVTLSQLGQPSPGRPGPVGFPLRNANPLRGQVRSIQPRPPPCHGNHVPVTTCPFSCLPWPHPGVPGQNTLKPPATCPGVTRAQSLLAWGRAQSPTTRGCCVPRAPPARQDPRVLSRGQEGAGSCTRIPPRGAKSSARGSYPSFPFRPRGISAGASPGPKAASPETAAGTLPGLSIPRSYVELRGSRKWRSFVELLRSQGGPRGSPLAPGVTGRSPAVCRGQPEPQRAPHGDTQPRAPRHRPGTL